MYSAEQRKIAIETFVKFDHSYADTIAELGYPTRACLRNWWNEYRDTGEVPISKFTTNPRYTTEMKRRAVEHYLEDPLAEEILRGNLGSADTIEVTVEGDKLKFGQLASAS